MNPIATAQYGMFAAASRFDSAVQRVARMGETNSDTDLTQDVVDMTEAKQAFGANACVLRTADKMAGDLLDMLS
ncbi:flagellar basal body rod C-terminal domain-containing protein [Phenylobacterium aquaticum]|uniref:flagellar basal body rod C-terminal domain-containing protein n=1 Tax=Phenylobacterium aquaticum TaxID=1763816 RepID=UPI0026F30AD3|nr:flagellar basal body rod C-terminal domain-containing protein [Phenylobacterium aquaticum]